MIHSFETCSSKCATKRCVEYWYTTCRTRLKKYSCILTTGWLLHVCVGRPSKKYYYWCEQSPSQVHNHKSTTTPLSTLTVLHIRKFISNTTQYNTKDTIQSTISYQSYISPIL
jgi:hypothetical protein